MLFGFCGFTAFTLADAQAKYLNQIFAPLQISFMCGVISLVTLLIFSSKLGGLKASFINPKWKLLWLRGIILGTQGICAVAAFGMVSEFAKAYTLIFIAPFASMMLGIIILKDKVGWRRWLSVAFGFIGVLIALRPGMIPLEMGTALALMCGFLAASSWVMMRVIGQGQSFLTYAAYPLICGLVISSYPALSNFVMPENMLQVAIIFGAAYAALGGIIMLSHAFTLAPADCVSPFHYTQLIFGVLWGYIFFEEVPDNWTIAGGAVIIASGLYIVYRERKKGKVPSEFEQLN
jgi:S-adenosylmethionine uptake transporter